jgi:Domain of unknown function (DUF4175)
MMRAILVALLLLPVAAVAAPVAVSETIIEVVARRPVKSGPLRVTLLEKPRAAFFGSEQMRLYYKISNAGKKADVFLKVRLGLKSHYWSLATHEDLSAREIETSVIADATGDLWAGQEVRVQVVARDGRGRQASSKSFAVTLPQRFFLHPLARDIGRVRSAMINREMTAQAGQAQIADLSLFARNSNADTTVLAALRQIYWRLDQEKNGDGVYELMWLVANDLEGLRRLSVNDLRQKLDRTLSERDIPIPAQNE